MAAQLLILGNGFDIACGLYSRYSDFFHDRYSHCNNVPKSFLTNDQILAKNILECIKPVSRYSSDSPYFWDLDHHSIWDIAFLTNRAYDKELGRWCDVETFIKKELDWWEYCLNHISKFTNLNTLAKELYNLISDSSDPNQEEKRTYLQYFREYLKHESRLSSKFSCATSDDVFSFLKYELEQFELAFGKYITNCAYVSEREERWHGGKQAYSGVLGYDNRSIVLFDEIKKEGVKNVKDLDSVVLSFNYTMPYRKRETRFQDVESIHGTAKKPIFGISSTETVQFGHSQRIVPITDSRKIFTKEYREKEQGRDQALAQTLTHNHLKYIKVFGHSLGEIDDQSFFMIFDSIKLYRKHTRLMFLYTGPIDERTLKESIIKLLKRYNNYLRQKGRKRGSLSIYKLFILGLIKIRKLDTPKDSGHALSNQYVNWHGGEEPRFNGPDMPTFRIVQI